MRFKHLLILGIASMLLAACNPKTNEPEKPSGIIPEQSIKALNKAKAVEQQLLNAQQATLEASDSE